MIKNLKATTNQQKDYLLIAINPKISRVLSSKVYPNLTKKKV